MGWEVTKSTASGPRCASHAAILLLRIRVTADNESVVIIGLSQAALKPMPTKTPKVVSISVSRSSICGAFEIVSSPRRPRFRDRILARQKEGTPLVILAGAAFVVCGAGAHAPASKVSYRR